MSVTELRIAEALAARLCHELVSPIGAIANGVEILSEDAGFAADAAALIGQSAAEASRRLQFYRLAYGSLSEIGVEPARHAAAELFAEGRCRCDWSPSMAGMPTGLVKIALNLLLVAAAALPRGGVVAPLWTPSSLVVAAHGQGARIEADFAALLAPDLAPESITPKTVQVAFTASLARAGGWVINTDVSKADCVSFSIRPGTGPSSN